MICSKVGLDLLPGIGDCITFAKSPSMDVNDKQERGIRRAAAPLSRAPQFWSAYSKSIENRLVHVAMVDPLVKESQLLDCFHAPAAI